MSPRFLKIACLTALTIASAQAASPVALADDYPPPVQSRFCSTIEAADAAYEPQRTSWYAEKNPIVQDRLTPVLEQMRDARDAAILNLLGARNPQFDGWLLRINSLRLTPVDYGDGKGTQKKVSLSFDAECRNTVTLKTEFILTPEAADFLAKVSEGSSILVSGTFFGHDTASNSAARALNWDGFQGTAMKSPSYSFTPTKMQN